MRRRTLSVIRVHRRPGDRRRGILLAGGLAIPVMLGRSGILANKREGDGSTPRGRFLAVRLWWRADRAPRPRTLLPVRAIDPQVAWCDEPNDCRYNRPFRSAASHRGDRLWRKDHLYDFVVEIDHNTRPRIAGRGSAVFIHVVRPERTPTAGCIALPARELLRLLDRVGRATEILVQMQ